MRTGPTADRLWTAGLALYVAALRLPYIGLGFGSDWDAWLLAASGRRLLTGGGYAPSRPPGYPLSEALFGAFGRFGSVASNLAAVIASVFAALALVRLLAPIGRMRAILITACAMSLPILIEAGSSTMDYVPSLALLLWALVFAERERPITSAVLLVLSVAARPAELAFAPVWLALVLVRSGRRAAIRAALIAAVGIVVCAIPALTVLGLSGMRPLIGGFPGRWVIARRVWHETFGAIGTVTLLAAGAFVVLAPFLAKVFSSRPSAAGPRDVSVAAPDAERRMRACLLWIGILGCAVFARMPYEAGYLIPPAVAGVAWVGMRLTRWPLYFFATAMLITAHVDPLHGSTALAEDAAFRRKMVEAADALRSAAPTMPRPAFVVTGFLAPQWTWAVDESDTLHGVTSLTLDEMESLRAHGGVIYFIPTIAAWHKRIHRVDLAEHGAIPLPTTEEILLSGVDFQN